ncbi:Glu-tRNA(Gln) amidotransferase subunit GatD [Methanobrevibacter olleyae]|uniref:Glutamyl-tRNA(Gln) amidotransferase subunit D n=1 Tax=Methanobrevibacter olleyae TaxID=294671 RepID=A0A126QZC9_METOL|nr:Glu-tRNA(Gln) amidotransferase subunit GatD [Methanobrevibacter olleyae]AMK15483.1 glutamyl-tRNA(Gln) amidotransferase subunit D GatD [Methanobrevibacter olleyae]SFL38481.1 glutamyl-tRNA(Gln) amidotransferase subunit D [Methanobrevibacter olleyae]
MTYKEISKEFLDKANVTIGDRILVSKDDISYEGILLDRSEDAKDAYIVIKLDSGYNVGVNIESATIKLIEKGDKPKIGYSGEKIEKDSNKDNISIISTGGTVSSIIDYKSGAVHPKFTAEDLLRANPELLDIANYDVKALYNVLSENMETEYWVKAAESVADDINDGADGIVIAHGTDTMHYTSAALSFMIKTPVPIVITGAQRSSDRPSTDAFLNIYNAVGAAKSDIAEVTVCMHNSLNDGDCALHKGTKVRKMHTSRRDTFRSINSEPIALLSDGKLKSINLPYIKRGENKLKLNTNLETKVALIKSFPGITSDIIDYHIDKGYKGLVIEGTGLGHLPDYMVETLQRANDEGIPVVMTSQCLYGTINMNVYSTGRLLQDAGAISGLDMTPETAYVKLAWALGQSDNLDEVRKIIQTNIAGELNESSSLKYFLN